MSTVIRDTQKNQVEEWLRARVTPCANWQRMDYASLVYVQGALQHFDELLAAAEQLLRAGKCAYCHYPLEVDDPTYTQLSATMQHNPTGCRTDALRAAVAKAKGGKS